MNRQMSRKVTTPTRAPGGAGPTGSRQTAGGRRRPRGASFAPSRPDRLHLSRRPHRLNRRNGLNRLNPLNRLHRPHRPLSRRTKIAGVAVAVAVAALAVPVTRHLVHKLRARIERRRGTRALDHRGLDLLTGLPNRAEAVWWLNARLHRAQARQQRVAVMVLDIDDFAECNAIYGRAAGDHVLQVTAARMQGQLRTGDIVCRTGSDTFLLIMDASGPDHLVTRIGERLVSSVAEPISFHGEPITVTASLGFALSQERDANPNLLLDRADRALIQAKASTRSIVQF
jgi:diguanylate cyclase (GGDEF)-like protein